MRGLLPGLNVRQQGPLPLLAVDLSEAGRQILVEYLGELLDFTDAGWAPMVTLFLAKDEGVPIREASDMIRQAATDELTPDQAEEAWQAWTQAHGDPAEYLLGMLQELGAVSLPDQPPGEGAEDGPAARTPPRTAPRTRTPLPQPEFTHRSRVRRGRRLHGRSAPKARQQCDPRLLPQ
jgi:hypothetical protein